jgi:hypothetical protein
MKLELDINDVKILNSVLIEVHAEWKNKTKEMQNDKNCPLENYNSHLDSVNSLGIIIEQIKEQL